MSKFHKLCKQHKIQLLTHSAFCERYPRQRSHMDPSVSVAINLQMGIKPLKLYVDKKFIVLSDDAHPIVKWHELGHHVHALGGHINRLPLLDEHLIIPELAASYWALQNCPKHEYTEDSRQVLYEAGMTYIVNGHNHAPDNDTYRILARKIGLEKHINWEIKNERGPSLKRILKKVGEFVKPTDIFLY